MNPRQALGLRAEAAAAAWLQRSGWHVLAHRWRCPVGELDLVATDPCGILVGVEVKVRSTARTGVPAESVDGRRIHRLRGALAAYAAGAPAHGSLRVDLITVTPQPDGQWRLRRLPAVDAW